MEINSRNSLLIRLTALTIVVVFALTFTAFGASNDDPETSSASDISSIPDVIEISSGYENSSNVTSREPQGFIWMDMESIRSEIDSLVINRYYEEINSESYTIPAVYFDTDQFYEIMELLKRYEWTEHREYINALQLKGYQLTVIGHDLVYTYLVFARDENGKCFVWSFYDYKITYPSEQDFSYIEGMLAD